MAELVHEWNRAAADGHGEALAAKQRQIADDAVNQLRGSEVLLDFVEFLGAQGAGDLQEWLIREGLSEVFTGERAEASRSWLLAVQDAKLQERLAFLAGTEFTGREFEDYLGSFSNIHVQSSLLCGYCVRVAGSDPEGAVQAFMDLRPKGVDFTGLRRVMAALPPGTDFMTVAGTLPGDEKSLARSARAALLGSWTYDRPAEAARYVISNPKNVSPEQLGVVIEKWLEESPQAATNATAWVEKLSPGIHRDVSMVAHAKHYQASEPLRAWQCVSQVGDFDRRVKAATEVYLEWEKRDLTAARAAWLKLFLPDGEK